MPDLDEFINKPKKQVPSHLEELGGVRPCSSCDEDVSGAFWDPMDQIMSWTCSRGHKTDFGLD